MSEDARRLACHHCGSTNLEAIETTLCSMTWYGVVLDAEGTIWPACREGVMGTGDTLPRVQLHCPHCDRWWTPRRGWDPLHDDDDRYPGIDPPTP